MKRWHVLVMQPVLLEVVAGTPEAARRAAYACTTSLKTPKVFDGLHPNTHPLLHPTVHAVAPMEDAGEDDGPQAA